MQRLADAGVDVPPQDRYFALFQCTCAEVVAERRVLLDAVEGCRAVPWHGQTTLVVRLLRHPQAIATPEQRVRAVRFVLGLVERLMHEERMSPYAQRPRLPQYGMIMQSVARLRLVRFE